MIENVSCRGLRSVLRKFEENGMYARGKHWHITRGGYDLWWQLYYDNIPVIDCVCNEIENNCLPRELFNKIFAIIKSEYDTSRWYPIKKAIQ